MKNYKAISERHKKMSYIWLAAILVSLVVFVALQMSKEKACRKVRVARWI